MTAVDHLAVHFALDGNLLHKDSEEARRLSLFQLPTGMAAVKNPGILIWTVKGHIKKKKFYFLCLMMSRLLLSFPPI